MTRRLISVLIMAGGGFFLLLGYGILRPVSNSLFISEYGAFRLPYVMSLVPITIGLAYWLYSILLGRFKPKKTYLISLGCSVLGIYGLYLLTEAEIPWASASLFLFTQTYIMLTVSQLWSFANSTLSVREGKRFNGPFMGMGQLGAISGSILTEKWTMILGSTGMLTLAAGFTIFAMLVGFLAHIVGGEPKSDTRMEEVGIRKNWAFTVFKYEKPALGLLLVVVCSQVVATLLDVAFHVSVAEVATLADERTVRLATFWKSVDSTALILQFVGAPLLMSLFSLSAIHFCLPLVHGSAALWLLFSPSLKSATLAFFLFKSLDYSVFTAAKEVLYIPLSFEARYRAKAVIDAFANRFAKGLASVGLTAVTLLSGAVSPSALAGATLIFVTGWGGALGNLFRKR